ncbi:hypothetical protein EB820_05375 [Brevibacillus agri]|uniref:Uncharacterized protein n=1 Tax=Brevibacillus agri TaxID=51101 RepID=A0A3M8B5S9_9BACL|nr:hypothetical protein [Brevibacillus agri]QAV13793.1 hypothetical protein BA6348_14060 [Brevibacillus agri]RNB58809.1 hypothetical protein EB820_05375 [Brevibacillus agri]
MVRTTPFRFLLLIAEANRVFSKSSGNGWIAQEEIGPTVLFTKTESCENERGEKQQMLVSPVLSKQNTTVLAQWCFAVLV